MTHIYYSFEDKVTHRILFSASVEKDFFIMSLYDDIFKFKYVYDFNKIDIFISRGGVLSLLNGKHFYPDKSLYGKLTHLFDK